MTMLITLTLISVFLLVSINAKFNNNINLQPRQHTNDDSYRFLGNATSDVAGDNVQYFSILHGNRDFIMVGARNAVYNLSTVDLSIQGRIDWQPTAEERSDCKRKGKTEHDCHNYIRVMQMLNPSTALVCGTHAFHPSCREYMLNANRGEYETMRQFEGTAIVPYDPSHNSTALYLPSNQRLYASTVSDFQAHSPLIYRRALQRKGGTYGDDLRTARYGQLADPQFVQTFEHGQYVYTFMRETAVEAQVEDGTSTIYARVARVCTNDAGSQSVHAKMANDWSTFLKARLNCSLPGDTPLQFNRLQSVSTPTSDGHVYAVLTTDNDLVKLSAVCIFSMNDIDLVFDEGQFKTQTDMMSLWRPVSSGLVPTPRPGQCMSPVGRKTPATVARFAARHPLMHSAVPSMSITPLTVDNSMDTSYTAVAVDEGVKAVDGLVYTIVFIGTSDGRVLKFVNSSTNKGASTILVSSTEVMFGKPITQLKVTRTSIVVLASDEIRTMPKHRCSLETTCSRCVHIGDPYCAWNTLRSQCSVVDTSVSQKVYAQSLTTQQSTKCPDPFYSVKMNDDVMTRQKLTNHFAHATREEDVVVAGGDNTAASLVAAILITLAFASTVGFVAGYKVHSCKNYQASILTANSAAGSTVSSSDCYETGRITSQRKLISLDNENVNVYASPPSSAKMHGSSACLHSVQSTPPALPMHYPTLPHRHQTQLRPVPPPNVAMFTSMHGTGTLPHNHRVKKVYL